MGREGKGMERLL